MTRHPIRSACDILFEPGQTVEVRLLGKRGTASGFFDNYDTLTEKVISFDNRGEYGGIYVTLNPVNPDLLARRANRIETRLGKEEKSAGDSDIISRRWLPVDIDPVRPSGVSSSEEEHAAAKVKAFHIAAYLSDLGWSAPIVADSGNGAHLLYRIDLPNDDESRVLVKGVLETLDTLFSDAGCKVDTANHNAARIWKLYGTTSRKGDNIESRPHRKAEILSVPDEIEMVSRDQLSHLARMFPKLEFLKPSAKDRKLGEQIDLGEWLSSYGIGYEQKPFSGGVLFILDECPFSSDHKDGAYGIQFASGAIFAGCHHNSCGGGSQRWSELRERFEGTVGERLKNVKNSRNRAKMREVVGGEPENVSSRTLDITAVKKEAYGILHEGDPLAYMLETFALDHIGDPVVAECLVMSLASRQVINAKGLHVSVTGESGKGKSHTFDTMMQQVPEDLRLEGRMSDKALFYIKGMKPGTVIALDDVSLSDQMQEVLKGVTTSFKKPFKYRTVNKDRGGETCIIPERCIWWVAKVEGTGDDQVWNRMLTCWIDDSEEQDAKVLAQMLQEAAEVPTEEPGIRLEVAVCQEIWRSLSPVHVVVPFAEKIRFSSSMNRRNPDMLLDLVKCHAVLMQHQRERCDAGNMVCVTATREDFRKACRLYTALNGTSGGQQSKLTKKESELVDAIRTYGMSEITITEMQHFTGRSNSVIRKMLHGTNSHGYNYSGLLEKCPAISVCDRTLVTDEGGQNVAHRREKAYTWDQFVYDLWSSDGGCWLDGHGPDDHHDDLPGGGMAESSGRMAEFSATKRGTNQRSKEENLSNTNFLDQSGGKSESMKQAISHPESVGDHIHDLTFSATIDHGLPYGTSSPADSESEPNSVRGKIRQDSATRENFPPSSDHSALLSPGQIVVKDFIEVEGGYRSGPCDCCGYKWVNYQERMTRERIAQSPRSNRKICKKCFGIAKQAEIAPVRALPGVLNIPGMVRLYKDLGRCQVCNGGKAVWYDPDGRVAICESCYHNHSPDMACMRGGV